MMVELDGISIADILSWPHKGTVGNIEVVLVNNYPT
jgi:hypothetical protein